MGGKCSPSGGIETTTGRIGTLKTEGKPNSRMDLYQNGERIQSRWYDSDGWVMWNRDYKHSDPFNNHKFPHDHNWKWNPKTGNPERISENLPENPNYC